MIALHLRAKHILIDKKKRNPGQFLYTDVPRSVLIILGSTKNWSLRALMYFTYLTI